MIQKFPQTSPATSPLIQLHPLPDKLDLELAYATPDNFTGKPVYARPNCYLHEEAYEKFKVALELADAQGSQPLPAESW